MIRPDLQPATPNPPQLQDYLAQSARRLPHKVALVCDGLRLTYAELEGRSNALAHALIRRGVRRGDRVVVFADNSVETVVAFWATLKANAVVSILHSQLKPDKLAHMLADCRPAAAVVDARHAAVLAKAAQPAELRATIVADQPNDVCMPALPGVIDWDRALAAEPRDVSPHRLNREDDLAAIVYSSGSMGDPKGIMLTHRNMMAASTSITSYLENVEDDVILDVLPLSFTYGLYQLITSAKVGARLVLERSFAYTAQLLKTVVDEGVTGLPGVPTMFARLAEMKTLNDYDLSRIRYVTNAAAALPVKHVRMLRELLPTAKIFSMYGQTECARGTYLPPELIDRKPDSIGIAIPNTEAWIVDESDRRLGANAVGQLVIRGPNVMKGYWNRPEATAEKLRPGPVAGEHVLYTGDLCRTDEDGCFYFVGRMDDTIKSRGEKVVPREVEMALIDIRGIREAAVIGVPDPFLGHAVKAFVVLEPDETLTEKYIQIECGKRLESFMVPGQVVFVDHLPRTESGKIRKAELR